MGLAEDAELYLASQDGDITPYHKMLQELNDKIKEMEKRVKSFSDEFTAPVQKDLEKVNESLSEISDRERAIREEMNAKLLACEEEAREYRYRRSVLNNKKNELDRQLRLLHQEMRGFSAEQARLLKMIAAQDRINDLEKRLLEFATQLSTWDKVKKFQMEDIFFTLGVFEEGRKGVLNANDMGYGKTLETAVTDYLLQKLFYEKYGRKPLCLWLTKKSLVNSSTKEIKKWNPDRLVVPVVDTPKQKLDKQAREFFVSAAIANNALVVTNYDSMNTTPKIKDTEWDIVYIDEVHKLKGGANPGGPTAIWTNAKEVCKQAKFCIFLSGSPIMNHPREAWAYLHIFAPEKFPTVRAFEREYCFGYGEGVKIDFERIIKVLSEQTIRRPESEVDINLPEGRKIVHEVEMSGKQLEIYEKMRGEFFIWLDDQQDKALTATAIIAQLTRLRQIAAFPGGIEITNPITKVKTPVICEDSAKIDEAMEIIEELVAKETPEQVVVFSSQFNGPLQEVKRRVEKIKKNGSYATCGLVIGGSDHAQLENDFQQKKIDVLCVNMMTGSEGLNLQRNPSEWPGGAKHAIFIDQWWNPEQNRQAEKRIYRQGADQDCLFHILHAVDSVDNFILEKLTKKQEMIEGIMDSEEVRGAKEWKSKLTDLL